MNKPTSSFEEGQSGPPEDSILAGEYVLGVLDGPQRDEAGRRASADPTFARLVEEWEQHFAPWLEAIPAQAVPEYLWPRIRVRLGWAAMASTTPSPSARPGLWRSAPFWRGATALATAAAIGAIYFGRAPTPDVVPPAPPPAVVQPTPAPPATTEPMARPVTVLAREDGATAWIASVASDRDAVLMVPVPSAPDPTGLVGELWIIPSGGVPLSLGFVSSEMAHTIPIAPALRAAIAEGGTLAVTLEPRSGMPHAAPSGPIVASGQIEQI